MEEFTRYLVVFALGVGVSLAAGMIGIIVLAVLM